MKNALALSNIKQDSSFIKRHKKSSSQIIDITRHSQIQPERMVSARIDLQGLNEELNQFKDGFDAWAQQSVAFAEAEKDKHLRHLRELQSEPGVCCFCVFNSSTTIFLFC